MKKYQSAAHVSNPPIKLGLQSQRMPIKDFFVCQRPHTRSLTISSQGLSDTKSEPALLQSNKFACLLSWLWFHFHFIWLPLQFQTKFLPNTIIIIFIICLLSFLLVPDMHILDISKCLEGKTAGKMLANLSGFLFGPWKETYSVCFVYLQNLSFLTPLVWGVPS